MHLGTGCMEINFPQPANGKHYLVDSRFAHKLGYMAPILDIISKNLVMLLVDIIAAFKMHRSGLISIARCTITLLSVHLMFGNRDERYLIRCYL